MTNTTKCANFDRYHDINLVDRYGETEAGIKVVIEDNSIYVFDNSEVHREPIEEYPAALREMKEIYTEYLSDADDDEAAAVIAENLDTLDRAINELAD